MGIEQCKTNILDAVEHNRRPWRAPELCNPKASCPYTKASDMYAVVYGCKALCIWCKEFSEFYKVPWQNQRQVDDQEYDAQDCVEGVAEGMKES